MLLVLELALQNYKLTVKLHVDLQLGPLKFYQSFMEL